MLSNVELKNLIHENLNIGEHKLINFTNLSDNEVEMVRRWRNSDTIREWMYNNQIISKEEHKNFIHILKETKNKVYWLVAKNDQYIGVMYFSNIIWNHRNAYLGIYTNPEKKIPGSGGIILSLILEVAFNFLNLHSLKLEVIENNEAAIRLYKKFDFKEEGKLKEFVYKDGKWKDVIIMGKINPKEEKQ